MRLKFIEQWKFKLSGRSVPVMKVSDIGPDGKVLSLQDLGLIKLRPNSLINTWDEKGYEIERDTPGYITRIDEKGIPKDARIVSSAGHTVDLYVHPYYKNPAPNREDVIGHAATMDDIADSMDLGKSMRNLVIGIIIGIMLGWLIIGPMINTMLS